MISQCSWYSNCFHYCNGKATLGFCPHNYVKRFVRNLVWQSDHVAIMGDSKISWGLCFARCSAITSPDNTDLRFIFCSISGVRLEMDGDGFVHALWRVNVRA